MNELLRRHVTDVGFLLTLRKTHIAALIFLNESIEHGEWISHSHEIRGPLSLFVPAARGLIDRGLVVHRDAPKRRPRNPHRLRAWEKQHGFAWRWQITAAGKLVVGLLREAGLYSETLPGLRLDPPGKRVAV